MNRGYADVLEQASNRRKDIWAAVAVIGVASLMRVWGLFHDLPFSFYGDELHFIKRSMALGSGDLNPHWFHKPALMMYVLAFLYGLYYLLGTLFGRFESVEAFGAHFLHDPHDFILIGRGLVAVCGIATAYLAYRMARKIYRSRRSGIAAGMVASVTLPMVFSSQQVKADVPSGFLIILALYVYLKAYETGRKRPLVIAALLSGVAMGTKYYGVILLPVFAVGELLRRLKKDVAWNEVLTRGAAILVLFVVGFFVVSPYNFLDPTWSQSLTGRIEKVSGATGEKGYDPDYRVEYEPGPGAIFGATGHLIGRIFSKHTLGLALGAAIVLGAIASLRREHFRVPTGLVIATILSFVLASVTLSPYHANARHLNAVLPVACVMVWPGVLWVVRLCRVSVAWRGRAAVGLLLLVVAQTTIMAIDHNLDITRLDSRVAAYRWALEDLPRDGGVLLDDYGPTLQPNEAAVERLQQRIVDLGLGEDAFSRFHKIRLDLLTKHPAPDGFEITQLGHPWWLKMEATNEELRGKFKHLDMGSPLVDRLPQTLAEYWKAGLRYVVTNGEARGRYFPKDEPPRVKAYPTWVAFYRSLKDHELIKTFDPKDWGGKGPIIWVYRLTKAGN